MAEHQNRPSTRQSSQEDLGGEVDNALRLGIDLGTSRSSIVSASGIRKTVLSYVGWPKDPVSRKMLGKDIVYGKEALDHQLAVDLYRPLERGVIKGTRDGQPDDEEAKKKNLEAASELLHHLVHLVEPGRDELLFGVVGVPAQATVQNKQAIIECAREVLDSVMIVSEPFSVAYGLERISDVLVIDIGAGTTDLCRMHGTVPSPEDQLSLEIAGDAIDEKLFELIKAKYPQAQLTVNMCKEMKELYGFVSDNTNRIEVPMPVNGKPTTFDVTDEIKAACMVIVEPILNAVHELVASFNPEFQERLRQNIILAGGGGMIQGLNKKIEDGMERVGGGHVTHVDEPMYAGANGALSLAMDMPAEYWQQLR